MNREITRRRFLQTTSGAALALGAGLPTFPAESSGGLVDTNVSLGRWPFQRLPFDSSSALAAMLRQKGVTQSWVANLNAAFTTDASAANAWLARECEKRSRGIFLPFGTVNPALPNWKDELQRCIAEYRMPGLRLYPNYHHYKLSDPVFAKFLSLATEHRLIVQITVSLEDERTQPPSAQTPHVDVMPLVVLLKNMPPSRVVLLNWHRAVKLDLAKSLAELGVSFDIATVENVGGVANLVGELSAERVFFGSHAPLFYFESAQLKLKESALAGTALRAVCEGNAKRLLGAAG
jgi:predicted TIM-barrel fold metal-dependent hydrolase